MSLSKCFSIFLMLIVSLLLLSWIILSMIKVSKEQSDNIEIWAIVGIFFSPGVIVFVILNIKYILSNIGSESSSNENILLDGRFNRVYVVDYPPESFIMNISNVSKSSYIDNVHNP